MARDFGSAKHINLTHNADQFGMTAITWCCWFQKTGALGSNGGYFYGKPEDDNDGTWILRWASSDVLRIQLHTSNPATKTVLEGTTTLSDDTWYHGTGRWESAVGTIFMFLDGAAEANVSRSGDDVQDGAGNAKDLFIGALTGTETARFMTGDICECAMWNRGLSDAEIAAVYRYGVLAVPKNLVVYIPVNGNPTTELEVINNRGTVSHTGSPAKADHPPRISTVGGRAFDTNLEYVASGAPPAGLGIPIAMHHYKMLRG